MQPFPSVISIPESEAQNGDAVWKFVVVDADDDAFTTCTLTGADAGDFTSTVDSVLGCAVSFNGAKDFDAGDESFTIGLLIDTGNVMDGGPITIDNILISIRDVDDEAPCFSAATLAVSISENTKAGSVIVDATDVTFSDPDTDPNYLEFNIASDGYVDFYLPTKSLPLIVSRRQFDYEVVADRSLTIDLKVTDPKGNTGGAACDNPIAITVTVTNENDNPLYCDPRSFHISLVDRRTAGNFGTPIACTDPDTQSFNPTCTLENADLAIFAVTGAFSGTNYVGNCQLSTVAANLDINDADPDGYFYFDLIVTDQTINGVQYTSTVAVSVQVTPVSNGALSLTTATYGSTVPEDEDVGFMIDTQAVLSYSDPSDKEYQHVWSMTGTGTNTWGIDPVEGYIYLIRPLDFEDMNSYTFTVTVERDDGTAVPPSTSADLTINIGNVNDEVPTFSATPYAYTDLTTATNTNPTLPKWKTLAEGALAADLDTFSVSDADGLTNLVVSIDSVYPSEAVNPFSVTCAGVTCTTSGTWKISLLRAAELDSNDATRLESNHYTVTISVTDGKYVVKNFYHVTITPANDNAPIITANPQTVEITEAAQVGSKLTHFTATDNDDITNQREFSAVSVRYTLTSASSAVLTVDGSFFSLDPQTGDLFLAKEIDTDGLATLPATISVLVDAADDLGDGNAALQVDVTINVHEVNDNAPECPGISQVTFVAVPESSAVGFDLVDFSGCDDIDFAQSQAWATEIVSGNVGASGGAQLFVLTANVLELGHILDYDESQRNFELSVRVYETDEGPLSSHDQFFTVIISVVPEQDGVPVWDTAVYTATMPADAEFGSLVVINPSQWHYSDPDGLLANDPDNPHAYGTLSIEQCQCDAAVVSPCPFTLDAEAEDLYVVSSLVAYSSCDLVMRLTDAAGAFSAPDATLTVTLDLDSVPVCDPQTELITILETQAASTTLIADLNCVDDDGDTLTFSLDQGDPNFEAVAGTGTGQLASSAIAAFDSSAKSSYNLVVAASDPDGNTAVVKILVIVQVVDDGTITCTAFPATDLLISEATDVNTILGQMSCLDSDGAGTAYGHLTYTVTGSNGNIAIDPTTGVIFLAQKVDFEDAALTNPVTVDFTVWNPDTSGTSETFQRTIEYTNVNDNRPTCTFAYDGTNAPLGKIDDGTVAGTTIAGLTCQDNDATAALNQIITLSMVGNTDATLFTFSTATCTLVSSSTCSIDINLAKDIDFDADGAEFAIFEFQVSDSKLSNVYSQPFVTVPVNEFEPVFDNLDDTVSVLENSPIVGGSSIFTVVATDGDSSVSSDGQVYYELDSSNGYFAVDRKSGEVFQIAELDYEAPLTQVLVEIVAKDETGDRAAYNTATLTVDIVNVNDEAPTWDPTMTWAYSMNEGTATGTPLATLAAVASDDPAADLRFSITKQSPASPTYFRILDATTGVITTTNNALDYETAKDIILNVKVCDEKGVTGCLSATAVVYVSVNDVNEFSPQFVQSSNFFDVSEDALVGFQIGQVQIQREGTQQDSGNPLDAKCSLSAASTVFSIDPNTCVLTLIDTIDREVTTSVSLTVRAEDVSDSTKFSTVSVTVDVSDVNDNTPTCTGGPTFSAYNIDEEQNGVLVQDSGSTDICVICSDNDATAPFNLNSVQYEITSVNGDEGDDSFALDYTQGACQFGITTNRELSYEDGVTQYLIEVKVTDNEALPTGSLTSYVYIPVVLNDVNEDDPVFVKPSSASLTFSIEESVPRGAIIYIVQAEQSEDTLTEIKYQINDNPKIKGFDASNTPTNQPDAFTISSLTGELMVNAELDYGQYVKYVLEIEAIDTQGVFGTIPTATITISIIDENNHTPMFTNNAYYTFSDPELSAAGTVVGVIEATDDDASPNSDLSFFIQSGNDNNMFTLATNGNPNQRNVQFALSSSDCEAQSKYDLVVIAVDGAAAGFKLTATTTVHVEITGVNEFYPQWDASSDTAVVVDENIAVGTVVGTILATDQDTCLDHGDIVYNIESQTSTPAGSNSLFALDRLSGEVTLVKPLDRELVESTILELSACDEGGGVSVSKKCTYSALLITVTDLEDNSPLCTSTSSGLGFTLPENAPIETVLVTLSSMCTDGDETSAFNTLTYSMSPSIAPFDIDASTGKVFLSAATLDFETTTYYTSTVTVSDGTSSVDIFISVSVTGVNEFAPSALVSGALTPVSPINIREDTPTDTAVVQLNYEDNDDGVDGEILCTLYNGTEFFQIDPYTCEVTLIRELDFEESPTCYEVLAIIYDRAPSANNVKSSEQYFTVCKTDFNDNIPICDPTQYVVYIDDDILANSVIKTVSCTDADSATDNNNVLTYNVASQTPAPTFGNFLARVAGTPNPGPDIVVSSNLDLETDVQNYFELSIEVFDQDNAGADVNAVSSNLKMFVHVRDINNYPPVITDPSPSPSSVNFQEIECCSGLTLVDTLTISDTDFTHTTQNVGFSGSIVSGNVDNTFRLMENGNWNELELHIAKSVDRETINSYPLVIEVYDEPDFTGRQRTATLSLTVDITDANDNNLLCNPSEVTVSILESTTGATGFFLPCTDVDTTGTMVATLGSGVPGDFATYFSFIAGPTTNTLQLNVLLNLDFLVNGNHSYQLIADVTDSAHRLQQVTVHVQIVDVDDGNGVLACSDVSIGEEAAMGTQVLDASTYFDDTADPEYPYGSYVYTFSAGNTGGYFKIEPSTGLINVARRLDREVTPSVSVTLDVSDGSTSVDCTFNINLDEYNDNAPVFNPQTYAVTLNEGVPTGTVVATLIVDDADDSTLPAGQVLLSDLTLVTIVGNDTLFALTNCAVPVTNQFCLETTANIDYDHARFHRFKITSADNNLSASNGPILNGFALVMIDIEEQNLFDPVIVDTSGGGLTTFTLLEDVAVGTQLTTISLAASDADSSASWFGRVRYTLDFSFDADPVAANKTFFIDQYTGSIYLGCPLDYESKTSYSLYMNVTDSFEGGREDSYAFTINVDDVNDEVPVFSAETYHGNIDDGSVNPNTVTITSTAISAVDADTNPLYNTITYAIDTARCSADSQCTDFTIDPSTAVISVSTGVTIDYDSGKMTYILPITASDPDLNFDPAIVYITVNDINDNAPVLFPDPTYISIYEQLAINDVIAQLTPDDLDSMGENVGFTFTQLNYPTLFSTDSSTGVVRVIQTLDRESATALLANAQFDVEIEVADHGTNPSAQTATATLVVEVLDINDNAPVFSQATYITSISECNEPYQNIVNISATDADFGVNSELNYTLGSNVGFFHLDEPTGMVTSLQMLDRESYPTGFSYKVVATDHGIVPMSGTATLQILIDDCNDETPIFDKSLYTWTISESASIHTMITTATTRLSASDRDEAATSNSQIKYNVTGSAVGVFEMFNEDNGHVRTAALLDRETQAAYSFDCIAYDQGTPQLTGTASCIVYLTDVNDESPVFSQTSYTITVNENLPIGDVIVTVPATDDDEPGNLNSEIVYSISDATGTDYSDAINYFNLGSTTGILSVRREIDYETTTEVIFKAIAVDKGSPALTGSTTVTVSIVDLNDNAPVFQPSNFYHAVLTPAFAEQFPCVETVVATDADTGQNGLITYMFKNLEYKFEIYPDSGCVSLRPDQTVRPDDKFSLRVIAEDNGNPSLSTEGVVRVDVLSMDLSVVKMVVETSYATFAANQEAFAEDLTTVCQQLKRGQFCQMGIIYFERNQSSKRKKRTATLNAGQSVTVYVYAYENNVDLSNAEADANFLTASEMLELFQASGDGTPTNSLQDDDVFGGYPIVSVEGVPKKDEKFVSSFENRWIVAIAIITILLILATLAAYAYFRYKGDGTRVTVVKPSGRNSRAKPTQPVSRNNRETSRGDEARRRNVTAPNNTSRQQNDFPDASKLRQKAVAPVIAPVPVGKPSVLEKSVAPKNLHDEEDKPDVGKIRETKPEVQEKPVPTQQNSDLDDFNGMAQDPATGRYYAYNTSTGKRRWLRTKEVEIMKEKVKNK